MTFVVQRIGTGEYWAGGHRWAGHVIAARWFDTKVAADLATLRELPDRAKDLRVVTVPWSFRRAIE